MKKNPPVAVSLSLGLLLLVMALPLAAQSAGDFDADGDIDFNDLEVVTDVRNTAADPEGDVKDIDGDGTITLLDARLMATQCLRPLCLGGTPATTRVENTSLSQAEGDSGSNLLSFTVTRTGDTAFGASVDYRFVPFGEFGVDDEDTVGPLTSGNLTFLPGESQRQVGLSIMGDTVYEPTEGLALELSNAQGTVLENHAVATIVENDDPLGAFTASGQGSFSENCAVPRMEIVAELTEQMDDLGYSVQSFDVQTYDPKGDAWDAGYQSDESTLMGPLFEDGEPARIMQGESLLVLSGCTPPSQFPWSIDLQLHIVAHDFDPDTFEIFFGPLMRASIGEVSLNQDNVKTVGGEFVLAITGDQLVYDEFEQSAINAGYDPEMLNLLRIPDIQIPDGGGLGGTTDLFTEGEFRFPAPYLGFAWNIHHEGYGTSHTRHVLPGLSKIYYRDADRPGQPFALEDVDPFSVDHESLVAKYSQDFDDVVSAVIAHFETEGLVFVGDQSLTSVNAVESNLGIGGFTFEGGQPCIDAELDCGHNSNDTLYAWPGDSQVVADNDYYVVVGLDYTLLDQMGGPMASQAVFGVHLVESATPGPDNYRGFVTREVHAARRELPLRSLPDWTGAGLSSVVTENSFLIQIVFSGNCPVGLDRAAICFETVTADPLAFISQLMLNPATGTRPDPDQVIPWRLLHFLVP